MIIFITKVLNENDNNSKQKNYQFESIDLSNLYSNKNNAIS